MLALVPVDNQQSGYEVDIASEPQVCALYSSSLLQSNLSVLEFVLLHTDASGTILPPVPGDYAVARTGRSSRRARIRPRPSSCRWTAPASSPRAGSQSAGTVHVSAIDTSLTGGAQGTFDVTFADAGELTGSFDAPVCATLGDGGSNCE